MTHEKHVMSAQLLGVFLLSSGNGAVPRKGCVVNGKMTKTSSKWVRPPSPSPTCKKSQFSMIIFTLAPLSSAAFTEALTSRISCSFTVRSSSLLPPPRSIATDGRIGTGGTWVQIIMVIRVGYRIEKRFDTSKYRHTTGTKYRYMPSTHPHVDILALGEQCPEPAQKGDSLGWDMEISTFRCCIWRSWTVGYRTEKNAFHTHRSIELFDISSDISVGIPNRFVF